MPTRAPRFRLRTLMALVALAAVGLKAGLIWKRVPYYRSRYAFHMDRLMDYEGRVGVEWDQFARSARFAAYVDWTAARRRGEDPVGPPPPLDFVMRWHLGWALHGGPELAQRRRLALARARAELAELERERDRHARLAREYAEAAEQPWRTVEE